MAPRLFKDDIPRLLLQLPDLAAAHQLEEIVDDCRPHDDLRRGLDQLLSHGLRTGDAPAVRGHIVALLVRLHRQSLERLLSKTLQDKNTIDDVIQEAVAKALASLEQFRNDSTSRPFGPWFHTIVRNTSVDDHRKKRVQDPLPLDLNDAGPGPDHIVLTRDDWDQTKQRLDGLSHWKRRVLQLRIVDGRTYKDILEIIPARDFPQGKLPSVPTLSRWIPNILAELAGPSTTNAPEGGQS